VLLIMREEFVGHLSEYEKECPSIFQHRFRLEKMGRADVRAVILNTLQAEQYRDAFSVAAPDDLTDKILSKLPDNQRIIELTYVQVFLNELWERAKENEIRKLPLIDVNLVDEDDKLEKILDSFLKKQILDLERSYPDNLPLEILAAMISERGTKLQLSKEEIETDLKRKQIDILFSLLKLLIELKERRVIRSIKSNDKIKYEISHDILAALIKRNKTKAMIMRDEANTVYSVYRRRKDRLLSQSDIDYLRPYRKHMEYPINLKWRIEESLSHIKKQEELALKIARRRIFSRGFISVVVISAFLGLGYWSDNLVDQKTTIIKLSKTLKRLQLANARKIKKDSIILDDKDNKYGFADRNGNVIINHEYDEATTFDYAGYAKVRKVKDTDSQLYKRYLLDKTGKRYRVEYSIYDARNFEGDEIFTALDLRGRGWKKIPIEIFDYGQLEVLLLGSNLESTYPSKNQITYILPEIKNLKSLKVLDLKGNSFKSLPKEIGELTSLEYLDLSYTKLDSLPPTFGQLRSLSELNLSNTNLSKEEKQKIKELLPNCKIKF